MKKFKLAVLLSLLLIVVMTSAAFADVTVVSYSDTRSNFTPPEGNPDSSLIRNGDFSAWTNGHPDSWTVWADSKEGWEDAHLANVDLSHVANRPEGMNNALGFFVRNIGGSGSYYAGAYQQLDKITSEGLYVVNVSGTSWYGNATAPYNTVAWYGIGDSSDPSSVSLWRELYSDRIVCPNTAQVCNYIGRDEAITIAPGQYFHLRVAHKFPYLNSWSTWVIDDISIVPADGSAAETAGYYNWVDEDDNNVVVQWNRNAPR